MKRAADATVEDIIDYDIITFDSPSNFDFTTRIMKDFFDRAFVGIENRAEKTLK